MRALTRPSPFGSIDLASTVKSVVESRNTPVQQKRRTPVRCATVVDLDLDLKMYGLLYKLLAEFELPISLHV